MLVCVYANKCGCGAELHGDRFYSVAFYYHRYIALLSEKLHLFKNEMLIQAEIPKLKWKLLLTKHVSDFGVFV